MEQEIKKTENNNKTSWQFIIAFMVIVLAVLAGSIIIILLQGGHSIGGKEVVRDAVFPLGFFILIWAVLARRAKRPTPRQGKIIKVMTITALFLFIFNILLFWLL